MSKNGFTKFRKNDYSYEDEEEMRYSPSKYLERKKEKRFDRALKTLDINALTEEEGLDPEDIEDEIWADEEHRR